MRLKNKNKLIDSFEHMSEALIVFTQRLHQSNLPLWLPLTDSERHCTNEKNKAVQLYSNVWHSGDGDGRITQSCHGVIGASPELISSAFALNNAKSHFKHVISQLKDKDPKSINLAVQSRSQFLANALNQQGLSRLHLKQCYRHIPIIEGGCIKVHFSWYASGRSIKRISHEQSLQMLLQLDQSSTHIQAQIQKLSNLRPGTLLAQVQSQVPVMRANAVWPLPVAINEAQPDPKTLWIRKARNSPLPLLIPLSQGEPLPQFNQPSLTAPLKRTREIRSDSIIETAPLLPSLRIHCYK
jgi:hypothetical protein